MLRGSADGRGQARVVSGHTGIGACTGFGDGPGTNDGDVDAWDHGRLSLRISTPFRRDASPDSRQKFGQRDKCQMLACCRTSAADSFGVAYTHVRAVWHRHRSESALADAGGALAAVRGTRLPQRLGLRPPHSAESPDWTVFRALDGPGRPGRGHPAHSHWRAGRLEYLQ